MRYVESVGARAVVPSAGPPCFLDPGAVRTSTSITGDEPSIFVDQRTFLDRLSTAGHVGLLAIPGTAIDVTPDGDHGRPTRWPTTRWRRSSSARASTSRATRPTGSDGSTTCGRRGTASGVEPTSSASCKAQLGAAARDVPDRARGHRGRDAAARHRRRRRRRDPRRLPGRRGARLRRRALLGSASRSPARSSRRSSPSDAVDWSNSLFLSCRFRAWREGEFNEYVYNFLKSLSRAPDATHRGRGAAQAAPADRDRARHRARRAGWCSGAARTATPTSRCSARSRGAS